MVWLELVPRWEPPPGTSSRQGKGRTGAPLLHWVGKGVSIWGKAAPRASQPQKEAAGAAPFPADPQHRTPQCHSSRAGDKDTVHKNPQRRTRGHSSSPPRASLPPPRFNYQRFPRITSSLQPPACLPPSLLQLLHLLPLSRNVPAASSPTFGDGGSARWGHKQPAPLGRGSSAPPNCTQTCQNWGCPARERGHKPTAVPAPRSYGDGGCPRVDRIPPARGYRVIKISSLRLATNGFQRSIKF